MFELAKKEFLTAKEALDTTKKTKAEVKAMLEERRKQDEEELLKPVLAQESQDEKQRAEKRLALLMELKKEIEDFLKSSDLCQEKTKRIIEDFVFVSGIGEEFPAEIKESAQSLIGHFLKSEDLESVVTLLKARSGSLFKETEWAEKRQKYIDYLSADPKPEIKDSAKYILAYGEYAQDIAKLFELCGRLDRAEAPKDFVGVYYSEETALLLAMAAIGEFGKVAQHIYYVPPYGTEDNDRESLEYCHDKAYGEMEASVSSEKQEKQPE